MTISEYHCPTCNETFIGDGLNLEVHGICGTVCRLLGKWGKN